MAKSRIKPQPKDEDFPDALTTDMGKRLRRARDDAALTQAELAEKISRRQASLSDMENGKMSIPAGTLARLAVELKKPISYFFPTWLMEMLQPEDVSPGEAELLYLAKQLSSDDLQRFIIQVRALVERNQRQYYEWLDEDYEDQTRKSKRK